ncbi:adhesion G-protein coupled receptor F3-like [Latimeria chalumnae]|uniref:adhesion G-protein coupled receptor F3-like n=1 Tax=Latimeria chalumnae TaxID=7897 RepID=UPI00313BDA3B
MTYTAYTDLRFPSNGREEVNSFIQSGTIKILGNVTKNVRDSIKRDIEVSMQFGIKDYSLDQTSARCVFWKFEEDGKGGNWSEEGCSKSPNGTNETVICICNHTTPFTMLMSSNVDPKYNDLFELITHLGLGVSIGSLCICIFIEILVWKSVVKSNISHFRHMSTVNIAFCLLVADACFLVGSFDFIKNDAKICNAITFLSHFFYLSLFFWSFCQSMMLFHQLVFLFHHLRKKVYMSLSVLTGYIFPLGIAIGTLIKFLRPEGSYRMKEACLLHKDGPMYAFIIPVLTIIIINFCVLIVVIAKLSRPSVSDGSNAEEKDTVKNILKAVLVLTPVFGLTWALGFVLFFGENTLDKDLRNGIGFAFAGMNAFQKESPKSNQISQSVIFETTLSLTRSQANKDSK